MRGFSKETYESQKAKVMRALEKWGTYAFHNGDRKLHALDAESGLDIFVYPEFITVRKGPAPLDKEFIEDLVYQVASDLAKATGYKIFDPQTNQEYQVPVSQASWTDTPPWIYLAAFVCTFVAIAGVIAAYFLQQV